MSPDDVTRKERAAAERWPNWQNSMTSGFIGTSAATCAAVATTPLYIAWTKAQLSMPLSRITRELCCMAGAREVFQVAKTVFPMTLRHSVAYIGVVNMSAASLAHTELSSFSRGCIAGGISALVETLATAGASRDVVTKIRHSPHQQATIKKLLYERFKKESPERKGQLKIAITHYLRAMLVTLLKNSMANSLTIGFTFYIKDKLEKHNSGSQWNAPAAGMLGALCASPFFMPAVVLQTKTFANIDSTIWQNLSITWQKEGVMSFWRGGFLRPLHKSVYAALAFGCVHKMEQLKDSCWFSLFAHAAGNVQPMPDENKDHGPKLN